MGTRVSNDGTEVLMRYLAIITVVAAVIPSVGRIQIRLERNEKGSVLTSMPPRKTSRKPVSSWGPRTSVSAGKKTGRLNSQLPPPQPAVPGTFHSLEKGSKGKGKKTLSVSKSTNLHWIYWLPPF